METSIVNSLGGVTLIAGGPVTRRDLKVAQRRAPILVAADGGADAALRWGVMPQAVIGDFDSLSPRARETIDPSRLHPIAEQETTDFDKALRSVSAPFVIGLGCVGGRVDHTLAALNALVRHDRPCVLLGGPDILFAAPPARAIALRLAAGARVSLFPLSQVTGLSQGLEWPINGLTFAPNRQIGTSNRAALRDVTLTFAQPGMIVILPRRFLDAAVAALLYPAPIAAPSAA